MTAQKFLSFAAVAVLSAGPARSHETRVCALDLYAVLNKTVCPVVLDEHVNMARVPQSIKVMRCARGRSRRCEAQHVPAHQCCQYWDSNYNMECVEIRDIVLVYYKSTKRSDTVEVPVGAPAWPSR